MPGCLDLDSKTAIFSYISRTNLAFWEWMGLYCSSGSSLDCLFDFLSGMTSMLCQGCL